MVENNEEIIKAEESVDTSSDNEKNNSSAQETVEESNLENDTKDIDGDEEDDDGNKKPFHLLIPLFGIIALIAVIVIIILRVNEWNKGIAYVIPPDTEVMSNVVLRVDYDRLKCFSLKLESNNGATHEVLVAVGNDGNGDGDLSFEETDFVWGMDCGERYLADSRTGKIFYASSGFDGMTGFSAEGDTLNIPKNGFVPAGNCIKIIKRGAGVIGERLTETQDTFSFCVFVR